METFYSAGLRLSELCNLKLDDADTQKGFIKINAGKGNKDRTVPIGHTACLWIRAYRDLVRCDQVKEASTDYLFLGIKEGHPINPLIVGAMIRGYAKQAGITKNVSAHTLRHTCASHLLKNGMGLLDIQELLGHTLISTTQKYTQITIKELIEAHKKYHPREAGEAGDL